MAEQAQFKKTEISDIVKRIIAKRLDIPNPRGIKPSADLIRDLGAYSISDLDIVLELEKIFGMKIEAEKLFTPGKTWPIYHIDGHIAKYKGVTVGQVIDYVAQQLHTGGGQKIPAELSYEI